MKGWQHRLIGVLVFVSFYFFKLFPAIINEFFNDYLRVFAGLIICLVFSAGNVKTKKWINFGLSPDNDVHKKKQRSMIYHSALFPLLAVIFFPYAAIYLAAFFYSLHILVDLLNPLSFEGKRYSYFLLFVSTILFFVMIYL